MAFTATQATTMCQATVACTVWHTASMSLTASHGPPSLAFAPQLRNIYLDIYLDELFHSDLETARSCIAHAIGHLAWDRNPNELAPEHDYMNPWSTSNKAVWQLYLARVRQTPGGVWADASFLQGICKKLGYNLTIWLMDTQLPTHTTVFGAEKTVHLVHLTLNVEHFEPILPLPQNIYQARPAQASEYMQASPHAIPTTTRIPARQAHAHTADATSEDANMHDASKGKSHAPHTFLPSMNTGTADVASDPDASAAAPSTSPAAQSAPGPEAPTQQRENAPKIGSNTVVIGTYYRKMHAEAPHLVTSKTMQEQTQWICTEAARDGHVIEPNAAYVWISNHGGDVDDIEKAPSKFRWDKQPADALLSVYISLLQSDVTKFRGLDFSSLVQYLHNQLLERLAKTKYAGITPEDVVRRLTKLTKDHKRTFVQLAADHGAALPARSNARHGKNDAVTNAIIDAVCAATEAVAPQHGTKWLTLTLGQRVQAVYVHMQGSTQVNVVQIEQVFQHPKPAVRNRMQAVHSTCRECVSSAMPHAPIASIPAATWRAAVTHCVNVHVAFWQLPLHLQALHVQDALSRGLEMPPRLPDIQHALQSERPTQYALPQTARPAPPPPPLPPARKHYAPQHGTTIDNYVSEDEEVEYMDLENDEPGPHAPMDNVAYQVAAARFQAKADMHPTYICSSCKELWWESSTTVLNESRPLHARVKKFLEDNSHMHTMLPDAETGALRFCSTCWRHWTDERIPPRSTANLMDWTVPRRPRCFEGLNDIEKRMLAIEAPYMSVTELKRSGHYKVTGGIVKLPMDTTQTHGILPPPVDDNHTLFVRLML